METKTFEVGKTYQARSIGDHNCIYSLTVAARTAKTIVTAKGKRLRISEYEGIEQVWPHGHYSMALIMSADRTKQLSTDWGAVQTKDTD